MNTIKKGSRGESVKTLQKILNLKADGIFGILTEEAVKEFQKANQLIVDGIVGNNTWNRLLAVSNSVNPGNPRTIKEIIVHCSATPEGEDYTVSQIRQMHLARGFSDIGYHYVIYRDGSVHPGRSEKISGAHCTGHNTISIGVCYIGGCPSRSVKNWDKRGEDTRTKEQKSSLIKLLRELKSKYPGAKIHSHKDFAPKLCPSFDATKEYRDL